MSGGTDEDGTRVSLSKPSIFEVVAHESVATVFKPAFHYVVKVLVQKYPEKLSTFLKYADEIYMTGDLLLQGHYLRYYNASLSENFYDLKRVDVSAGKGRTLSVRLQYLSLFALAILPYVKAKMDKAFENLRDRTVRQENGSYQEQGRLSRLFLKSYPLIHFVLQAPFGLYQLGYTLGVLHFHDPVFHTLKIQLVRASSGDLLGLSSSIFPRSESIYQKIVALPGLVMDKVIKVVTAFMPVVIFFLQFIDWWYSSEHEMTTSVNQLPIPPPPKAPKVSETGCGLPPHPLQCPLCHKVHHNMAALVSSGFVFCYPCIHQYVAKHGSCPVTDIPSSLEQILRIYSVRDS